MGIQIKRTASEPLPEGMYEATFQELTEEEGKFGPQLKAKFQIEAPGYEGRTLTGWASRSFSPKSKLYGWVKAAVFGGRDIPETYQTFDSDHLIGRRVLLLVETAKGSDGETYNKITTVLPYRPAAPAKAQPAVTGKTQPAAVTARPAANVAPEPGWPEIDETKLQDPGPEFEGDMPF